MSLFIFFGITLYFSCISFFSSLFVCNFSFLTASILCAAGGMAAQLLRGRKLRFLGLILPLLTLTLGKSLSDFLVLFLPLVFSAAVILQEDRELEYYRFRDFFRYSAIFWGLAFLVIFLLHAFEGLTGHESVLASAQPFQLALFSAVSGCLLLRSLRLGTDDSQAKGENRKQLLWVTALFGGFAGIWVMAERLLIPYANRIKQGAEAMFLGFYSLLLSPFVFLVHLIDTRDRSELQEILESVAVEETRTTVPLPTGGEPVIPVEEAVEEAPFPWWLVILILAVLALILFLIARLTTAKNPSAAAEEIRVALSPQEKKEKEKKRTNRQKVRSAYRDYLKKLKKNGCRVQKNYTSEDFLNRTPESMNKEAARELRSIYLSARYDEQTAISTEQAKKAGSLQRKIK